MIITLENLSAGISWWQSDSNWGADLLNSEYEGIYSDRALGITTGWWEECIERLSRWRAFRGPKAPNTKAEIKELGRLVLGRTDAEYLRLCALSSGESNIGNLRWEEVEPLFSLALEIKSSAVFASKMCHFLFPNLFIVMDNWATDVSEYEIYWRGAREAWCHSNLQDDARSIIREAINKSHQPHQLYPFDTKAIELCHIGYKHKNVELTR